MKNVYFRDSEAEIKLFKHASTKRNFSEWVKLKLEEDMQGTKVSYIEEPKEEKPKIDVDDNMF